MKGTSQVTWPTQGQSNDQSNGNSNGSTKAAKSADDTIEQDVGRHFDRMLDLSRIKLVDERVERKVRGYNPYDAQTARPAARDPWSGKPKRD